MRPIVARLGQSKVRVSTVALGVVFDLLLALYFLVRPDPGTVVVPASHRQRSVVSTPAAGPTPSRTSAVPAPSPSRSAPASASPSPGAALTSGFASSVVPPSSPPSSPPGSSPGSSSASPTGTASVAPTASPSVSDGVLGLGSPTPAASPAP